MWYLGFLDTEEGRKKAIERALKWPSLFKDLKLEEVVFEEDPDPQSIIVKDAERTFSKPLQRKTLSRVLFFAHNEFGDYHQGLSFVTSFLMLFLDGSTVMNIIRLLNSNNRYLSGYWKHEALIFARDAYVFDKFLKQHNEPVHAHLAKSYILPETYLQKWFTALCIHVLEFEALFKYFELFFERGFKFLIQFGLAFFERMGPNILKTTNPANIYAYLRMDRSMVDIDDDIANQIFDLVDKYELKELDDDEYLEKLRVEAFEENLRKRFEAKNRAISDEESEEDEEDEEGLECQICEYMVPEHYCIPCEKYICEACNEDEKGGHKKEHKLVDIEDAPVVSGDLLSKLSIKEEEES